MDNEDTQRTPAKREPVDRPSGTNDAFLRALLQLQATGDAIGAAIRDHDLPTVRRAAVEAFSFLLSALSVFHRMETKDRPRTDLPRIGTAWYALRTHHRAIADLFARAKAQLADVALHQLLEQLEGSLALALKGISDEQPSRGD